MTGASAKPTALVGPEGLEPHSRLHASHDIASAFTPGPWGVEPTTWNLWIGPMRPDGLKVESIVVSVSTDDELKPGAKANREANANLIASAPELYEALEYARDLLRLRGVSADLIDNTLAKARGEQVQP